MKSTLIRIAIYIPVITAFYWIFTPNAFDAGTYNGPLIAQAAGYITYYGLMYGFWMAIYEGAYRAAKWMSKPKPIPIPDTQPLPTYRSDVDEEWYRMHKELHRQEDK